MKVIILAAGMGSRLMPLTNDRPKCMVKLLDDTLIERQIKIFRSYDINDITIVTGYKNEVIDMPNVNYVNNPNYETTNMNESLFCALKPSNSSVLVTYGDIVFEPKIVQQMLEITNDIRLAVRINWKEYYQNRTMHPLSEAENVLIENGRILETRKNISKALENQQIGEFLGIMMLSSEQIKILLERYSDLKKNHTGTFHSSSSLHMAYLTDMLQEMIDFGVRINPVFAEGKWFEIDTLEDIKNAEKSINEFN
jgi:L-glutamine-phosphate cytidylyltransferase